MTRTLTFFLLIISLTASVLAQSKLPLMSELEDLRNKKHYFLIANEHEADLAKQLSKNKLGLIRVTSRGEADFIIEYKYMVRDIRVPVMASPQVDGPQYRLSRSALMTVSYVQNGTKVVVWSNAMSQGRNREGRNLSPKKDLVRWFLREAERTLN